MANQSTIRAFQKVLKTFRFIEPASFSEDFAQKRFLKKFQEPDHSVREALSQLCWKEFLSNDDRLPEIDPFIPVGKYVKKNNILPIWYKVRDYLHSNLGNLSFGEIDFPKGSEFSPTNGQNSVEARLSASKWTCTYENFESFSKICYNHKALKRSVKQRYRRWFESHRFDITMAGADSYIYRRFKENNSRNVGFDIFTWKLRRFVIMTHGSRFSTVPKNNEAVRPINIEPFGNILSQRAIGNWIRSEIKRLYRLDLDTLADDHRRRIRDVEMIATIDLKNASDSISTDLVRFLLPERLFKHLASSRSQMILGPDNNYHVLKKISSMGNGFTFELMSLILLSACRELDPESSVFGDDIIIRKDKAAELIKSLTSVGLVVNDDKSFTTGPFRESCGGNYHLTEGYIESYDFMWPESIGDCVVVWNKVVRLKNLYASFLPLYHNLYRTIPPALQGGPNDHFEQCDMLDLVSLWFKSEESRHTFPLYFVTKRVAKGSKRPNHKIISALRSLQQEPERFKMVPGFEFKSELRSASRVYLTKRQWAKYEMYLDSGRVAKDTLRGRGKWCQVWFVNSDSQSYRAKNLVT